MTPEAIKAFKALSPEEQRSLLPHLSDADAEAIAKELQTSEPSTGQKIVSTAKDFGKGLLEGAGHTLNMGEDWAAQHLSPWFTTPIGQKPTPENSAASVARYKQLITPANTTQALGKNVEQIGEFLLPTGIEEGAARLGGAALGKGGEIAGHILGGAGHSALINKAQGGSATEGALMGAGGSALGQGVRAVAPHAVELAQGIRGEGGRAGKAILDETSGLLPGSIRNSARGVLSELNPRLNAAADESTALLPMAPARQVAGEQIAAAQGQNQPRLIKGVKKMANQLMEREYTPILGAEGPSATLPIPDEVPARDYLELRRGVGKALPSGSWSPESSNAFKAPRNAIYGTMTNQFHEAVPETAELDRRISSLIPATEEPSNFLYGHALGPVAGGILGGLHGYRSGGLPTALEEGAEGSLAGLVLPAGMNAGARIAASPLLPKLVVPAATGTLLQATDRSNP